MADDGVYIVSGVVFFAGVLFGAFLAGLAGWAKYIDKVPDDVAKYFCGELNYISEPTPISNYRYYLYCVQDHVLVRAYECYHNPDIDVWACTPWKEGET